MFRSEYRTALVLVALVVCLLVDGGLMAIFGPIVPLIILTAAVVALVVVVAVRIGLGTSCGLGGLR